ncbi:MAG: hypothetical protein EOM64_02455 [Erysipelotrichia bacterium]|nr:hypothetical protein [Erysipelotrichia bacterium]
MREIGTEQDEISEAIGASEVALSHLIKAQSLLKSAGNWGVVDILGGGMITTFLKHSKMNDARSELQMAKNALMDFRKELRDLDAMIDISIGEDFLDFADYFFDGAIADFMVQSRISETKRQVDNTIYQVQRIHDNLLDMMEKTR